MSTPTIDLIYQHGSVRNYKKDPVSDAVIEEIVAAGQRASTSSNLQTYSVVVTTDKTKIGQIQEIAGGQKHIAEVQVFMLWCAHFSRLNRACLQQGYHTNAEYL